MALLKSMLKQVAVYWPPAGANEYGQQTFGSPIEIKCRWEDRTEMFLDKDNNEKASKAVVYVDRDLVLLGVLWLSPVLVGEGAGAALSALTSLTEPFVNAGAAEIRRFDKLPDIRARKFLRSAYL